MARVPMLPEPLGVGEVKSLAPLRRARDARAGPGGLRPPGRRPRRVRRRLLRRHGLPPRRPLRGPGRPARGHLADPRPGQDPVGARGQSQGASHARPRRPGGRRHDQLVSHGRVAEPRRRAPGVVAVCDPDRQKAARRAEEFGIPHVYQDAEAMLAAEALDALDVASPRETHAAWVEAAAARGIDVLCQKPLTPTLGEAEQLVRRVEGRTRLMVHENWRFRPWYRDLRRWIGDGPAWARSFSGGWRPSPRASCPTPPAGGPPSSASPSWPGRPGS